MKSWKRVAIALLVTASVGAVVWAAETKEEIIKRLWPKEHCEAVLKDIEKQKADGLITPKMYERKVKMVKERMAGTFQPTMLATTNPPLNLLQNASFEDFNPNTNKNMSRWDSWGGWAWPEKAQYLNDKESRPEYVKSGKLSAKFTCTGAAARVGIQQKIPMIEGATDYELTIWAKGEGENMLNIAYEDGARGNFSGKIGPDWQEIKVVGKPDANKKQFTVWIYIRGLGTIWLDDAKMVPVGVQSVD